MKKKTKKESKNCLPEELKGCAKISTILAAVGVFVVFFAGTLIIAGKGFHWTWKEGGEKFGKMNQEGKIENLEMQVSALKKQVSELKGEKAAGPETENSAAAGQVNQTSAAFEKAVNDKDFTKVESLMASRVYYVIDASDCCGDITKKEATANLQNYIRGVKSFNFDQDQQVVNQMKVNLAGTFAKYTIGIADNKMVLSYHLDKQGKVDDVMLSASHLMYDLE